MLAHREATVAHAVLDASLVDHCGAGVASAEALSVLSDVCPHAAADVEAWVHKPAVGTARSCVWLPTSARALATKVACLDAKGSGFAKKLMSAIDRDWACSHTVIHHDRCPKLGKVPSPKLKCWKVGQCV